MTFTGATDFGNFTINTSSGASANTGAAATTAGVIDANDLN
jgi:hypothetical protein